MAHGTSLRVATAVLAAVVVLLAVLAHAPLVDGAAVAIGREAARVDLVRFLLIERALDERSLATWQTALLGGSPLHASPSCPTLYPPALVAIAALGSARALGALAALHAALGALGAFLLVRRLVARLGGGWDAVAPAGAAVAATCAALSPFARSEALSAASGAALAWTPWVLLAADALVRGSARSAAPHRARRASGGLALALGLQLWTGGLDVVAYTWLALAIWLVLGAGPARYPRMLAWGALVLVCFAGLAAAALAPFLELGSSIERAGALAYADARGATLAGRGEPGFVAAARGALAYTGGGAPVVLALASLALARRSAALRAALVIAMVGVSVALGAATHRYLAFAPPFDRIQGAIRAWTMVHVALPVAAGFGAAWLLARAPRLRARPLAAAAAGGALSLALAPLLARPWGIAAAPEPIALDALAASRPAWERAALAAGGARRAAAAEPRDGLEPLLATLAGVETTDGDLGDLRPRRLARHLDAPGEDARERRLAALGVAWLVADRAAPEDALTPVPGARPRAFLPSAAIGVIGDDAEDGWLYALLDAPELPLARASLIAFEDGSITPEEAAALDAAILVGAADAGALARLERAGRVARVGGAPSPDVARRALERVLDAPVAAEELALERLSTRASAISLERVPPRAGARFAVVSEPWALYPGWRVEAGGRPAPLRRADGAVSAVLVPADARRVEAHYRPRSVALGVAAGALALAVALFLACAPPVRPRARDDDEAA